MFTLFRSNCKGKKRSKSRSWCNCNMCMWRSRHTTRSVSQDPNTHYFPNTTAPKHHIITILYHRYTMLGIDLPRVCVGLSFVYMYGAFTLYRYMHCIFYIIRKYSHAFPSSYIPRKAGYICQHNLKVWCPPPRQICPVSFEVDDKPI